MTRGQFRLGARATINVALLRGTQGKKSQKLQLLTKDTHKENFAEYILQ